VTTLEGIESDGLLAELREPLLTIDDKLPARNRIYYDRQRREAADRIEALEAEVARCHERLEIGDRNVSVQRPWNNLG